MHDIDLGDLIEFANLWMKLGESITSQVSRVVSDSINGESWAKSIDSGDVNPAAIQIAYDRLADICIPLDEVLVEFLEQH